jgi:crotonobetainyl-CoA:carnitine CoA-transferase CaiB-like acyl-CoA transferase
MEGSLGNLRVVDFSRVLAGPFATMLLADLGAEVVKIERPGTGDETRTWGPPYDASGEATYFQSVNRNKSSVTIDLADPAGLAQAQEMAAGADVIVENFRPGLMDSLGLGYDELSARDPALIYCSITGFGREGGAALPGYDLLIQALGGLMSITGPADGEPQKAGVAVVDVLTGLFSTVGILAALQHRTVTGRGQRVDVDLMSSLLAALINQGSAYTSGGVVAKRMGNDHPSISPYELYRTGDGEIVIAVGNDRQFAGLCEAVGRAELAGDPRFAVNSARVEHRRELREALEAALGLRGVDHWVELLSERRVPAGRVNDIAGAFALAESLGLAPTVQVPRADGSTVRLTRNPIRLSETPARYVSAPPPLGGGG